MVQIVTPEIPEKERILKNYYNVLGVYGGLWIIFYLTIVFFFWFTVGSPLLVGIFLGIGNIWSMIIDVPLSTIQRQVSSKTMISIANAMMLLAAILFLYLVYSSSDVGFKLSGSMLDITRSFFTNGINIVLLLIIGILYGTIKEIYDIATLSYLLNHIDPSEYDKSLSKCDIVWWIWSYVGIFVSIPILWFQTQSVQLILFLLIFLIILSWIFIYFYFDNSREVFNLNTVKNLHIIENAKTFEKTSEQYIHKSISTIDFEKAKHGIQYVILKPKEIVKRFDWGDILEKTKQEYRMIYKLLLNQKSFVPILLWATGVILLFGCWDNVATTFFVDFLDESLQNVSWVKNIIQSWFVLIGIISIPAYVLQGYWIKKAKKFWRFNIIVLWLMLAWGALLLTAAFGGMQNLSGLVLVVWMGLINSSWYAAGYPMSQSIFIDEYNQAYANANNTSVINADASAAPLQILNNFANAVGLIFAWALITFFGFFGMLILYGSLTIAWGILGIKKRTLWKLW